MWEISHMSRELKYLLCSSLVWRRWRLIFLFTLALHFLFLLNLLLHCLFLRNDQHAAKNISKINHPTVCSPCSPYRPWWSVQILGKRWPAVWFWDSLQNIPPQIYTPPERRSWQTREKRVPQSLDSMYDVCRLTCAVLLSLANVSSCSLLALMNSFSTKLSSCTRNSFLHISIPRSSERMSCKMPSNDTLKGKKNELLQVPSCNYCSTMRVWFVPRAALSTKCNSV